MLPSTDQGHFYKYLTTLGVATIVASLGIGGFFLQVQNDLLIENTKISAITPVAREAIGRKQQIILFMTKGVPWFIGGLILVGLVLIVVGLVGWKTRQDTLDQKDQAELSKVLAEVQLMSEQEKQEKALDEAAEVIGGEVGERVAANERVLDGPSGDGGLNVNTPEVKGGDGSESQALAVSDLANRTRESEAGLVSKLKLSFGGRHEVRSGFWVKVADGARLESDAMVVDKDKRRLYIFELKMYRNAILRHNVDRAAQRVVSTGVATLSQFPGFELVPVMVILLKTRSEALDARILDTLESSMLGLKYRPLVLIYSIEEFDRLAPEAFRRDINIARNKMKHSA